jgi:enoyl-CoA hydratase/carnithine racemase
MLGYLLPRRVNAGAAAEMAFTGRLVGAEEAVRIGLVDRVLPLDHLRTEASALCVAIAAQAPLSLRFSKLALRRAGSDSYEDYARFERYIFGIGYSSEDAKEAIRARREKRAPQFKGF